MNDVPKVICILGQPSGLTVKFSGIRRGPRERGSILANSPEIIYVLWLGRCERVLRSWVAKFKGDKIREWKLSIGWSRSYKVIKLLLSAGKWVVAKLQGGKSASQSSMELYYPWISGPLCVSWMVFFFRSWESFTISSRRGLRCTGSFWLVSSGVFPSSRLFWSTTL